MTKTAFPKRAEEYCVKYTLLKKQAHMWSGSLALSDGPRRTEDLSLQRQGSQKAADLISYGILLPRFSVQTVGSKWRNVQSQEPL